MRFLMLIFMGSLSFLMLVGSYSSATAQKSGFWDVQELLPACESLLRKMASNHSDAMTFTEGLCLGIVTSAMQYGSVWFTPDKKLCFPQNMKPGQAVTDVVFDLKLRLLLQPDKAEVLAVPFMIAAAVALHRTYPCQKG